MSRDSWLIKRKPKTRLIDRRSPAERLGYEPCPTCGGRRVKSAISAGLHRRSCEDGFHGSKKE